MSRRELERARRTRCGVIGLLECCRCMYPVERYETETQHDETCPAHAMTLSARRVSGDEAAYLQLGVDLEAVERARPEVTELVGVARCG